MTPCEYVALPQTLWYLSELNQNANPVPFTSTCEGLLRAKKQTNKKIVGISGVEISHCQAATVRTKLSQIQYE